MNKILIILLILFSYSCSSDQCKSGEYKLHYHDEVVIKEGFYKGVKTYLVGVSRECLSDTYDTSVGWFREEDLELVK